MKYGPWKIWNGGKRPVSPETRVQVQLARWDRRRAEKGLGCEAGDLEWEWPNCRVDCEIIAYREVIEPVERKIEIALSYLWYGAPFARNATGVFVDGVLVRVELDQDTAKIEVE